jgi:hypothetical protein
MFNFNLNSAYNNVLTVIKKLLKNVNLSNAKKSRLSYTVLIYFNTFVSLTRSHIT